MKRLIYAMAVVLGWTVSSQAAVVYLKDGGTINASKVWREKGAVVVLLNRDSITSFAAGEINLKRHSRPSKNRSGRFLRQQLLLSHLRSRQHKVGLLLLPRPLKKTKNTLFPVCRPSCQSGRFPKGRQKVPCVSRNERWQNG